MEIANPVSLWSRSAVVLVLAWAMAGCGSGKKADEPLKTIWDHFAIDVGGHPAELQVALLGAEQERGLMQRPDLGKNEGMVFVFPAPRRQEFWMRNTPEPLDIAYLRADGAIAEIYHLLPLDERSVPSMGDNIQIVVEMPQGWYEANGVRPGARLDMKALLDAVRARGFEPSKLGLR